MGWQPKGKGNEGQMAYFTPGKDPTQPWEMHPISEPSTPPELKDGKPVPNTGKVSGQEFDLSVTGSFVGASGSVGYGKTTGKTNWVENQTVISGKSKVDIRTEDHTQLDGSVITADHGCDPTWQGSDHTREHVPVIAFGPAVTPGPVGKRKSFADIGQRIAKHLGLPELEYGEAF